KERVYSYDAVNVSLISPYIFDASVKQIFPALLLGHTLVVVPESTRFDGGELLKYYNEKNICISDGTPVLLSILSDYLERVDMALPVKRFVIGGEALEQGLVDKFMVSAGQTGPEIINVYGPTECCDVASTYTVPTPAHADGQRIPIGTPIANVKVYILGKNAEVQGLGIPGELHIAGSGLGRGYLNHPELTAQRFVKAGKLSAIDLKQKENQGGTEEQRMDSNGTAAQTKALFKLSHEFAPGRPSATSLYKTGDLARWLPDGNIEFLGRI
ncbi:MAG: AMP-binding protein, partial [bacterium]|nr:AMP-binding protein [bacterium]